MIASMSVLQFFTALLLAAASWAGADLYRRAARDAAEHVDPMPSDLTRDEPEAPAPEFAGRAPLPDRPAIDLEVPGEFRTATFALG